MKRPIRKALGRAGWTVAIAGGLGVTAVTTAQISPYAPIARTTQTPQAAPAETPGPVADDHGRLAVMKVELAWLADPVTFPHALEARVIGTVLEVRGEVPNETIRQQALRMARDASGMRIMDGLQLRHKPQRPSVGRPSGWLHQQAITALQHALPQCVGGITVDTWTDGQVVVKGTVPTYEDKLTASRCLHGVSGCNCVINQLSVLMSNKDRPSASSWQRQNFASRPVGGREATSPSAPITLLPAEPIKPQGRESLSLVRHLLDATARTTPLAAPSSSQISQAGQPTATNLSDAEGTTGEKAARKIMAYTTKWHRLGENESSSARNEGPPKPEPAIVEARPQQANVNQENLISTSSLGTSPRQPLTQPDVASRKPAVVTAGYSYSANSGPQGVASTPSQPSRSNLVPATYAKVPETTDVMDDSAKPASTPPTHFKSPYPMVTYPSHLVPATTADSLTPAKKSAAAPTVKTPSSVSRAATVRAPTGSRCISYVTTGVVVFEIPAPVAQPVVNASKPVEKPVYQSPLQKHIAAACGRAAKDVEITTLPDKSLQVRIQARSAQEGDLIAAKVFQMPELAPYQVSLDVPVMP